MAAKVLLTPEVFTDHVTFELVEKPVGTMDLLLLLRKSGVLPRSEAVQRVGTSQETFYCAVERLRSLGFLYEQREPGFPPRVSYGLTDMGEEAADSIDRFADVLSRTRSSLERELEGLDHANGPETVRRRLEILQILGEESFSRGEYERSLSLARRQLDLAKRLREVPGEISALLTLGRLHLHRDELGDARRWLCKAYDLAVKNREAAFASDASRRLGAVSQKLGEMDDAIAHYDMALQLAESVQDNVRTARVKIGKGLALCTLGKLDASSVVLREAVATLEAARETGELPRAYLALGVATAHMSQPEALDWFEKTIATARRVGETGIEAYGMLNVAAYLVEKKESLSRARTYLDCARRIFEDIGEKNAVSVVEVNTGILYTQEAKWRDAEAKFDVALRLAREAKNSLQEAQVIFNWGLMEKERGNADKAKELLTAARDAYRTLDAKQYLSRCDEALASL